MPTTSNTKFRNPQGKRIRSSWLMKGTAQRHELSHAHRRRSNAAKKNQNSTSVTVPTESNNHEFEGGGAANNIAVDDELILDSCEEYSQPGFNGEGTSTSPIDRTFLSVDMQNAIDGRVTFDAGGDTEDDTDTSSDGAASDSPLGCGPGFWSEDENGETQRNFDDGDLSDTPLFTKDDIYIDPLKFRSPLFDAGEKSNEFSPYPNEAMLRTDILFNSPRLRFSRAQQEAVLRWAADLGADVPSLYALDLFQAHLQSKMGIPTIEIKNASGNIHSMNDIEKIIGMEYSTPELRRQMDVYPTAPSSSTPVTGAHQSTKWLIDAPNEVLTPMIRLRIGHEEKTFYVHELTGCADGKWFIPERFFRSEGKMWAVGHNACSTPRGIIVASDRSLCDSSYFRENWPDIEQRAGGSQIFSPESQIYAEHMPNPDRVLSDEDPDHPDWECPPLIIFCDDMSGNSTTQWNVHYSCYMSNASLPRVALEKERNIHFLATSPNASPMELFKSICDFIRNAKERSPMKLWCSMTKRYVFVRPWLLLLPGDNPMQSELCSHIGLNGNMFCRSCSVGGTTKQKETDEGFKKLMTPGEPRRVSTTIAAITAQLEMATYASAEKKIKTQITSNGVKDSSTYPLLQRLIRLGKDLKKPAPGRQACSLAEIHSRLDNELNDQRAKGMASINPLLTLEGFDVHRDTPVEILHTHLLGVVKYFWAQTTEEAISEGNFSKLQARLNSINERGLNLPGITADYMCRYRGGLIGKHFKTLVQIMIFVSLDIVPEHLIRAWSALGCLTTLIWSTEIANMDSYVSNLEQSIADLMTCASECSPSILITKPKFHILTHLPENVRRFGPAVLYSTERYEAFNRLFRLCSIHSNRQAPSRDIAKSFSGFERCRHILRGGYWYDMPTKQWIRASSQLLDYLKTQPGEMKLLGILPDALEDPPGSIQPKTRDRKTRNTLFPLQWTQTLSGKLGNIQNEDHASLWDIGQSVVCQSGDKALVEDHVIVKDQSKDLDGVDGTKWWFGRVAEILSARTNAKGFVSLRVSILDEEIHSRLRMPCLTCTDVVKTVKSENIVCVVNVQHNCSVGASGCTISKSGIVMQERKETTQRREVVNHATDGKFVINLHAIHNHQIVFAALPPRLLNPSPLFADANQIHLRSAAGLRQKKMDKALSKSQQVANDLSPSAAAPAISLQDDNTDGRSNPQIAAPAMATHPSVMGVEPTQEPELGSGANESNTVQLRGPRGRQSTRRGRAGRGSGVGRGAASTAMERFQGEGQFQMEFINYA